jgi:hypothetical protein
MRLPVLLLLLLSFSASAQNNIADAYMIRTSGDTLRGRVLLPRDFDFGNDQSFADLVWITGDSSQQVYTTSEVAGFGVRKRRMEAHYRTLQLEGEAQPYFAKVLQHGPRFNLYFGARTGARLGARLSAAGLMPTLTIVDVDMLVLQDQYGELLPMRRDAWNSGRAKLKRLVQNDPQLLKLFNEQVIKFNDVVEFVKAANAL